MQTISKQRSLGDRVSRLVRATWSPLARKVISTAFSEFGIRIHLVRPGG
ncbi:hypothetical protein AKJ09_02002 [Labilithrix luteola]|uniref:Uncharacterized protein n=1 Tax=Labilithrix luteola TaxID=1391654 RepID=A0A0K1PP88_9BACT|nr:hypothetical protein AKJ09_02002 [Labilithrix luteola]